MTIGKELGFTELKFTDDELDESFDYYRMNEPHLQSQVINPLQRAGEITRESLAGFNSRLNDRYAELVEGLDEDKYTSEHIAAEREKAFAQATEEAEAHYNELVKEHDECISRPLQVLKESMQVEDITNEVDSSDMLVMQSKLNSELKRFDSLSELEAGGALLRYLDQKIELAKSNKKYAKTLSTLTYMIQDKAESMGVESSYTFAVNQKVKDIHSASLSNRYKADAVTSEHIKRRYRSGVTRAGLEMATEALKKQMSKDNEATANRKRVDQMRGGLPGLAGY